ncbi:MAG TPA: alpha-mannosidase [Bacillota bacterium]|nr:alpha-mannosidase [Bacillota bacterium]
MYFLLEHVSRIARELKGYVVSEAVPIEEFQVKEGNFRRPEDADKEASGWTRFHPEMHWGGRDCHAWFRAEATIPQSFAGMPVAISVQTGDEGWDAINPQFILYIDGKIVQGLDFNHREAILCERGEPGRTYRIDLKAYSGMREARQSLHAELIAFDEKVRKLYYDIAVPLGVLQNLSVDDKVRFDMLLVLNEALNRVDFRRPRSSSFYRSVNSAEAYLEEELYRKMCGHEDVFATCIGHTHIDVAWLWRIAQTREKAAGSFATALKLMDEYPEYVFMSSQPQLYKFVKEDYPALYEEIRQRVREGRWEPEGSMWVEADCNVVSGESLVRQIMFGKRFFSEEFGVDNKILWLPDVFGYSAALPQIMRKSGIDYFMTTKISWNQFNKLPYDTFMWRGIDGSEVLTHFITTRDYEESLTSWFTTYNGDLKPSQVMGAWQRYQQKALNNDVLISYGHGDGGGGTTREMIENGLRMARGIPGCPRVRMETPRSFFGRLDKTVSGNKRLPTWVGELYLEFHRGTYTSMGRNKRANRKSELLYGDVETLSSFAMLMGADYPQEDINRGWEGILTNQFHDILPGSSIKEVYDDSREDYDGIISSGHELARKALDIVVSEIGVDSMSVVVFNTLGYDRDDVAEFTVPENLEHPCVVDSDGQVIPCQVATLDEKRIGLFTARGVPAKGYKTYTLLDRASEVSSGLTVNSFKLENAYFELQLDEKGTLLSIYDKVNQRQVLKKGERGNRLLAFQDMPANWQNWDIDISYQEKMWEVDRVDKTEILEVGPVRAGIRIHKTFLDSKIIQDVLIYSDIPRIDFRTYIDWKESQILLKAAFPVDVNAEKATYEIQFGNVERPTHWNTLWDVARFEVCGHRWADLSEGGYGVSLMNDCKYGYDIKDGEIRLTLLKSGIEPNPVADQEEHWFTYSLYPHGGDWKAASTVKAAYSLNVPLRARVVRSSAGSLPKTLSMIRIDADNVMLETVKKAESSDEIVVRLYEFENKRADVKAEFFRELTAVSECDLLENEINRVSQQGSAFSFEIRPYEIKTFKLKVIPSHRC